MSLSFKSQRDSLDGIYAALFSASEKIYAALKKGSGLKISTTSNESGDDQLELDVFADEAEDFSGKNIIAGGFFVFGMNLEAYFADGPIVYKGIFDQTTFTWTILPIEGKLPSADVMSLNACNQTMWHGWMQDYYISLFNDADGTPKPHNMRWYASMVSDVKRLVLQGGLFAYPAAKRKGYENGHLRLVYEAIPMSFFGSSHEASRYKMRKVEQDVGYSTRYTRNRRFGNNAQFHV